MEVKTLEEIEKWEFQAFEDVRKSGVTNMWMPIVQELAGIERDVHVGIILNYSGLCKKWPDVRSLDEKN